MTRPSLRAGALAGAAAATLLLSACSTSADSTTPGDATITVAAAFYPLQYVAERVGGDAVDVIGLTPPGAEPHDFELPPSAVREVRDADLVLYLSGFQPTVDDAVEATGAHGLDATDVVPLVGGDGTHVGADPHFWLDPTLLDLYGTAVAERLAEIDPAHADLYRANDAALSRDLAELDAQYSAALTSCQRTTILTSHEAFGYLATRYGLTQVGLSGIDPDAEPSPARLREVRALAASVGATTVYVETLVDPSVVEAFAHDAGLSVATLDPIGGLVAPGDDYLIIMRRNLDVLKEGLGCA